MSLEKATCTACRPDAPRVTEAEKQELMQEIPGWEIREFDGVEHLVRSYEFSKYADGLRFTIAVGEMADEVDHHPTLITVWGKVTIHWWTHKINGLHKNDFIMAYRTNQLYADAG